MKTTVISINETWVQCLTNNIVFQIEGTSNASPGEFTHHRISSLVGKTLLLQVGQLEAHLNENFVTVSVQLFIVQKR